MNKNICLLLCAIGMLFLQSCREEQRPEYGSFESMGTYVFVRPSDAASIVEATFNSVDIEMSEWKNDSALSKVNEAAGISPIQCSTSLCNAVELSLTTSKQTDGAFDPTWACMWELWDFNTSILPTKDEVASRLPLVNWKNVLISGNTIFLKEKGMMLGLGGIAKGVALNQSRDALLEKGMTDFMIVSGGQVLVQGKTRRVGIRKPDGFHNEFVAIVHIKDTSISTSGDYEKFFELNGIRYHHILDPRTGFPATSGTRSVTVISKDAAEADALSTALFILGSKKAITTVNAIEGVEALVIDANGVILLSNNFVQFFSNADSVESSSSANLIAAGDQ